MTDQIAKVIAIDGNPVNFPDFQQTTEALNNAKEEFIKTVNDKSKWAALFLFAVSFFLIWVIIYYIYSKLSLESNNNEDEAEKVTNFVYDNREEKVQRKITKLKAKTLPLNMST